MEMKGMQNRSKSFIAIPPGATIKEQLEDRNMSQKEFAVRMDMSEKHISRLVNGEVQLTSETANSLECVLGVPASFWNKLEAIYRDKLVKVKEENEMSEEISLVHKFPYAQMANLGWVPHVSRNCDKALNLRKFFEVVNLKLLNNPQLATIACRRISDNEKADYALMAWAQKAKLLTRDVSVKKENVRKIKALVPEFREMTRWDFKASSEQLKPMLSECGVAFVMLPHIGGSFLHGATFLDKNKIVMGLTCRRKTSDVFWFSFFHELGHIVLGHIHDHEGKPLSDEEEKAADVFAGAALIPDQTFSKFVDGKKFTKQSIIDFASAAGVHPSIVVGRLQKEKIIPFNKFNGLKMKIEI